MVDRHVLQRLGILDTRDNLALFVRSRVARRGKNYRDRPVITPAELNLVQALLSTGEHNVHQVILQARQNDLRLRIAKACVELQYLGACRGKHKATIEAAAVVDTLGVQLSHRLAHNALHGLMLLGRHDRHRAVNTHAARVGTKIALKGALVVLRGCHRAHGNAVRESKQRALGAYKHLLNNHRVASLAKGATKALAHSLLSLLKLRSHNHALASSQTVSLNNQGSTLLAHVSQRRLLVSEGTIGSRRHTSALHQTLRKELGALHLCTLGARTKARNARRTYGVSHAHHERSLGANNNHAAVVLGCKRSHCLRIFLIKCNVLANLRGAAVARCNIELAAAGRLGELFGNRVLATTAAQEQDVHNLGVCVHWSSSLSAALAALCGNKRTPPQALCSRRGTSCRLGTYFQ